MSGLVMAHSSLTFSNFRNKHKPSEKVSPHDLKTLHKQGLLWCRREKSGGAQASSNNSCILQ